MSLLEAIGEGFTYNHTITIKEDEYKGVAVDIALQVFILLLVIIAAHVIAAEFFLALQVKR